VILNHVCNLVSHKDIKYYINWALPTFKCHSKIESEQLQHNWRQQRVAQ